MAGSITKSIENVLIIGAGWVGRQVAMQIASHGYLAYLNDESPDVIRQAIDWSHRQGEEIVGTHGWTENHVTALKKNLRPCESLDQLGSIDLIIECVPEQISLKKRVLKKLSEQFPFPTLLTSNSSYFVPSMFAKSLQSPERFLHYHFHVPVFISTFVDIMPSPATAPEAVETLSAFSVAIGQEPLVCRKEQPGYVFNWLLQSLLKSALELSQRGVADPKEIDLAWRSLTGMPLGPFGIIDQIGVDVIHQVLVNARWATQKTTVDELIQYLQPMIDSGKLGQKTGEGFFQYNDTILAPPAEVAPEVSTDQPPNGPSNS